MVADLVARLRLLPYVLPITVALILYLTLDPLVARRLVEKELRLESVVSHGYV